MGTTAADRGLKVIVAAAGKAAHLGGVVAAYTPLPVVGVPMKTSDLGGMDSLLSMVQMPSGVPVHVSLSVVRKMLPFMLRRFLLQRCPNGAKQSLPLRLLWLRANYGKTHQTDNVSPVNGGASAEGTSSATSTCARRNRESAAPRYEGDHTDR